MRRCVSHAPVNRLFSPCSDSFIPFYSFLPKTVHFPRCFFSTSLVNKKTHSPSPPSDTNTTTNNNSNNHNNQPSSKVKKSKSIPLSPLSSELRRLIQSFHRDSTSSEHQAVLVECILRYSEEGSLRKPSPPSTAAVSLHPLIALHAVEYLGYYHYYSPPLERGWSSLFLPDGKSRTKTIPSAHHHRRRGNSNNRVELSDACLVASILMTPLLPLLKDGTNKRKGDLMRVLPFLIEWVSTIPSGENDATGSTHNNNNNNNNNDNNNKVNLETLWFLWDLFDTHYLAKKEDNDSVKRKESDTSSLLSFIFPFLFYKINRLVLLTQPETKGENENSGAAKGCRLLTALLRHIHPQNSFSDNDDASCLNDRVSRLLLSLPDRHTTIETQRVHTMSSLPLLSFPLLRQLLTPLSTTRKGGRDVVLSVQVHDDDELRKLLLQLMNTNSYYNKAEAEEKVSLMCWIEIVVKIDSDDVFQEKYAKYKEEMEIISKDWSPSHIKEIKTEKISEWNDFLLFRFVNPLKDYVEVLLSTEDFQSGPSDSGGSGGVSVVNGSVVLLSISTILHLISAVLERLWLLAGESDCYYARQKYRKPSENLQQGKIVATLLAQKPRLHQLKELCELLLKKAIFFQTSCQSVPDKAMESESEGLNTFSLFFPYDYPDRNKDLDRVINQLRQYCGSCRALVRIVMEEKKNVLLSFTTAAVDGMHPHSSGKRINTLDSITPILDAGKLKASSSFSLSSQRDLVAVLTNAAHRLVEPLLQQYYEATNVPNAIYYRTVRHTQAYSSAEAEGEERQVFPPFKRLSLEEVLTLSELLETSSPPLMSTSPLGKELLTTGDCTRLRFLTEAALTFPSSSGREDTVPSSDLSFQFMELATVMTKLYKSVGEGDLTRSVLLLLKNPHYFFHDSQSSRDRHTNNNPRRRRHTDLFMLLEVLRLVSLEVLLFHPSSLSSLPLQTQHPTLVSPSTLATDYMNTFFLVFNALRPNSQDRHHRVRGEMEEVGEENQNEDEEQSEKIQKRLLLLVLSTQIQLAILLRNQPEALNDKRIHSVFQSTMQNIKSLLECIPKAVFLQKGTSSSNGNGYSVYGEFSIMDFEALLPLHNNNEEDGGGGVDPKEEESDIRLFLPSDDAVTADPLLLSSTPLELMEELTQLYQFYQRRDKDEGNPMRWHWIGSPAAFYALESKLKQQDGESPDGEEDTLFALLPWSTLAQCFQYHRFYDENRYTDISEAYWISYYLPHFIRTYCGDRTSPSPSRGMRLVLRLVSVREEIHYFHVSSFQSEWILHSFFDHQEGAGGDRKPIVILNEEMKREESLLEVLRQRQEMIDGKEKDRCNRNTEMEEDPDDYLD